MLAMLAAATSSILTGSAVVATRYLVTALDPLFIAFLRYGVAALLLLPLVSGRWPGLVGWRDWLHITALGVLFFAVFPWSFSAALEHTTAARGALVLATMPLLAMLLGAVVGVERFTTRKLFGTLLAVAGVGQALGESLTVPGADDGWNGELLMLIATCSGAVYALASRPLLARHSATVLTAATMAVGALTLTPLAVFDGVASAVAALDATAVLAMLYLAVMGGAVAFFLWTWAIGRIGGAKVTLFLTLNPITAIILGHVMLGEPMSAALLSGAAAVVAGIAIALTQRSSATRLTLSAAGAAGRRESRRTAQATWLPWLRRRPR